MTYNYVLAFGDSTTAGCELILNSEDWEQTKLLSFPNQLANKLGIPCINYAWPGGSNDRSLRLLPEALLTYPNSLVLFTYTSFDRTEFFTLDNSLPQVKNEGYAGLGICWNHIATSKHHQDLNNLYFNKFFQIPDNHNRYKMYNTLLMVQVLCQLYAKNFFQIFLYNNTILPPDYQQEIYNKIDKGKIYQFDFANDNANWKSNNQGFGSLQHWAIEKKYPFCPGGHIGQVAHDNFALELYNKVI